MDCFGTTPCSHIAQQFKWQNSKKRKSCAKRSKIRDARNGHFFCETTQEFQNNKHMMVNFPLRKTHKVSFFQKKQHNSTNFLCLRKKKEGIAHTNALIHHNMKVFTIPLLHALEQRKTLLAVDENTFCSVFISVNMKSEARADEGSGHCCCCCCCCRCRCRCRCRFLL